MKNTVKYAFGKSMPVLLGYIFMGISFGILMSHAGYGPLWSLLAGVTIYAGSGQFLLVSLLSSGAALSTAAVMTLLINSRHIFYGLSFIDTFKKIKRLYPYMIFSLTDETYSVLCSVDTAGYIPAGVDKNKAMFFIALFDHLYWITGCFSGALIGTALSRFDFTGIDFSMTALFTVLFVDQWKAYRSHLPALIGLICAAVFLLMAGPDKFLLPSLGVTVAFLVILRKKCDPEDEKNAEDK